MSGIQVPGQNRDQPNPLLVLAVALDKANQYLHKMSTSIDDMEVNTRLIAANTTKSIRHQYGIAQRDEDTWGSYCIACSDASEAYVYPCEVHPDAPKPPSHITILPTIADPTN